jgi:hypothetical protein
MRDSDPNLRLADAHAALSRYEAPLIRKTNPLSFLD